MSYKEDQLDIGQIQANVLPGFKMPYQYLLACRVSDRPRFCNWLKDRLPQVTFTGTALAYHHERIAKAKASGIFGKESFRLPAEQDVQWLNIAFSSGFMGQFSANPTQIDDAFRLGLAKRSGLLGDPADAAAEGNPAQWLVGGPGREADLLLIVASDSESGIKAAVVALKAGLVTAGMEVLYGESGERLDNDTEHFGFKDGLSQPEPRGYTDKGKTFLTPRKIKSGNEDPATPEWAAPGELLVWPGQFVYGYQKQDASDFRKPVAPAAEELDAWVKNGSMLVFRRLKQDVAGFYQAAQKSFEQLQANPAFAGWQFDDLLNRFVGRRKDGTPLIMDSAVAAATDPNHFFYQTATPAMQLKSGGAVPAVSGDLTNSKCPMFAHIRKVNPRDNSTDQGGPTDTLTFRILRRGIPFGPRYNFADAADPVNLQERGLLFLSYQTSIQGQFELLVNKWMNTDSAPEPQTRGYDLLVGQNAQDGAQRLRSAEVPPMGGGPTCKVDMLSDFITPTGGGYFFVPSLEALEKMAASAGAV